MCYFAEFGRSTPKDVGIIGNDRAQPLGTKALSDPLYKHAPPSHAELGRCWSKGIYERTYEDPLAKPRKCVRPINV